MKNMTIILFCNNIIKMLFCYAEGGTKILFGGRIENIISIPDQIFSLLFGKKTFPNMAAGYIRDPLKTEFGELAPNMYKVTDRVNLSVLFDISLPRPFAEVC